MVQIEDFGFLGCCVTHQLQRKQCILACTFGGKPKCINFSKSTLHKKIEKLGVVVHTSNLRSPEIEGEGVLGQLSYVSEFAI